MVVKQKPCGVWARSRSFARHQSPSAAFLAPERVGDRDHGHRAVRAFFQRPDHRFDDVAGNQRPRGIMDQHKIRRVVGQCFQPQPDRILPRRAADDGSGRAVRPWRRERAFLAGADHHLDRRPAKASTVRRSIGCPARRSNCLGARSRSALPCRRRRSGWRYGTWRCPGISGNA